MLVLLSNCTNRTQTACSLVNRDLRTGVSNLFFFVCCKTITQSFHAHVSIRSFWILLMMLQATASVARSFQKEKQKASVAQCVAC